MNAPCAFRRDAQRLVDAGELPSHRFDALRGHARACGECRRLYEKGMTLQRALERDAALASLQLEAVARAVLPPPRPARRWFWTSASVALAGAAAAVTFWIVPRHIAAPAEVGGALVQQGAGSEQRGVFQVRSAAKTSSEAVRSFCIQGGAAQPVPEGGSCPRDALLQLAYSNREATHLFVFGLDARRRPLWYFPTPPETKSLRIEPALDEPLPGATRLSVNHRPGELTIHAIFSRRPLSAALVEKSAPRLAAGEAPAAVFGLGPGEHAHVSRLVVAR